VRVSIGGGALQAAPCGLAGPIRRKANDKSRIVCLDNFAGLIGVPVIMTPLFHIPQGETFIASTERNRVANLEHRAPPFLYIGIVSPRL
jgi:hypothetical protein